MINNIQNNNRPSFGIRYKSPKKWNVGLLETVMKSDFVRELESKYPKAVISQRNSYAKISEDENIAVSAILKFKLNKGMEYTIKSATSKTNLWKTNVEMCEEIAQKFKKLSLNDVEKSIADELAKKQRELDIINAAKKANRSSLIKSLRQIFHLN